MRKSFFVAGPYEIYYADTGPIDAERTLLIFNGIGSNVECIEPFMEMFGEVRVITFDIPGVGASPAPYYPYKYATMANVAARLLDHLSIDQVDVYGVSWGGGLAQQFAHNHQERVRTLILAATSPGYAHQPGKPSALRHMFSPSSRSDPSYVRSVAGELYGGRLRDNPDLIDDYVKSKKPASKRGYYYQVLAISTWTSWNFLPKIKVPTLVLVGDDDPITPPLNGKMIANRLPNARLESFDCGHLFMFTMPEETKATIQKFWESAGH